MRKKLQDVNYNSESVDSIVLLSLRVIQSSTAKLNFTQVKLELFIIYLDLKNI